MRAATAATAAVVLGLAVSLPLVAACGNGGALRTTRPSPTATAEVRTAEPRPTGTPDQATGSPTPTASAGTATPTPTARPPSPTVETPPTPTAVLEEAATQLAYVDTDRNLWLVNADGTARQKLMEDCSPFPSFSFRVPFPSGLVWSADGEKIACVSLRSITIADTEGRSIARVERGEERLGIGFLPDFPNFAWSPNGDAFAYVIDRETEHEPLTDWYFPLVLADASGELLIRFDDTGGQFAWSPDGETIAFYRVSDDALVVYETPTEKETVLAEGLRPLAWLAEGALMLVASDYRWGEFGPHYEANLLEVGNGELTRVPELDSTQFWVSPDRWAIAFLVRQPGARTMISVLDLATRRVSPIEDSAIGFPSEGIPFQHVALSADGTKILFADAGNARTIAIYRANRDGTNLTNLGTIDGHEVAFSPDGTKVAYLIQGPHQVGVVNVDGGDRHVLRDATSWGGHILVAWRPAPRE